MVTLAWTIANNDFRTIVNHDLKSLLTMITLARIIANIDFKINANDNKLSMLATITQDSPWTRSVIFARPFSCARRR